MNKCGITLPQIQSYIAQELEEWQEEEEGIGELKNRISKVIKYINDNNHDNIDNSTISDIIWEELNNPIYSSDAIRIEFDKNYFINSLNTILSGVLINNVENTEKLYNVEEVNRRKNSSLDFLIASYGSAIDVKRDAIILQKQYIVDSCFVGRGNIPGVIGLVKNSNLLNYNIRLYQQHLLNQIVNYIKTIADINLSEEELQLLHNPFLYINTSSGLEYSGILEKLIPLINKHLNPNKFTPETLRKLYNSNIDSDKKLLQAYNSYVFLSHFDTFLSLTLGKSIQIDKFGIKTGKNKYNISEKTNNLMTTWRTSDEIFVENEIDNITKLLITTLPVYNDGTNTIIKDTYLQFGDFTHIIGKIKLLGLNALSKDITFNQTFIDDNLELWDSLSINTKNTIKNKNFSDVINSIRRNPRKFFSAVFELLCNENFKLLDNVSSLLSNKSWNKEEKQKLYSLYKGIFSEKDNSLKSIVGNTPNIDYYGFIILAADSIFKNSFIQLYTDAQGNQQTRLLIDLSIYNIKQQFIRDVNAINNIVLNTLYETGKLLLYNIRTIYNKNNKPEEIKLTIPNTKIEIITNIQTGYVQYSNDGKILQPYELSELIKENEDIINFINEVLPLNISVDSEIFKILKDIADSSFDRLLLNLTAHVLTILHIQNTELKGIKGKSKITNADNIFGGSFKVKYNSEFKQLNVISDNDTLILNAIANAKAISYGLTTASQIKDSNQASQSLQSFSRLLGSYLSQWTLQNSKRESASKDLLILKHPELFEGHYTINEAFTKGKNGKKAVKLSVSELTYSALMFNFLPGFTEFDSKNERFIQDGHVGFIASVNSDKNTVGTIKINLNTKVEFVLNGEIIVKPIKDLDSEELEALISQDLGVFYINVLNNINSDFEKLTEFIKTYIPSFTNLNYLSNFSEFNMWWDLMTSDPIYGQEWLKYGNTPVEFIKYFTRKYNNENRLKPITLIDLVHVTLSKTTLSSGKIVNSFINNDTLIAQIARFQPLYLESLGLDVTPYTDSKTFWKNKLQEVLDSLIKCKFEIDLSKNSPETQLLNKYKTWVSKSGKMILGKVTIKGKQYNITSKKDLRLIGIETGYSERDVLSKYESLEIHPMLKKYNYLEYLFTQEWMNSTLGSFIAHKGKGSNDIELEASRFAALHKRNVSFTAQKQLFLLNSLNGINEDYNIAVIEDIKIKKQLLRKSGNSIKPFDGATFVNPFFVYLENNSLFGAKAGINKKQFVHFIDPRTGTSGIIKTAGFGLTNDSIRNSAMDALMMKKMTSNNWIDEFGNQCEIDITTSWKNDKIKYELTYWQDSSGKYFKLLEINKSLEESNTYDVQIVEVDISGKEIGVSYPLSKKITNNYDLWLLFGGSRSMSLVGKKLLFSESSVKNVVIAMNNIGLLRIKDPNDITIKYDISEVSTQDELWQPLKLSDIAYIVTEGAIKQGGANINSSNEFYNTDKRLDFQRIKMYEAGILLDKEHHATDSELSLPTLIVSACVSKGYSIDEASRLYNSLRQCTEVALKTLIEAVSQYIKNYGERTINMLNEEVFKLVIENLANSSGNESFASIIAKSIDSIIKNSDTLKEYRSHDFPLSDNTIFRKVLSTVSSYLTKQGIRIKIPGLLAVLNPSHDRIKLYGNKKFENFYNPNLQLEELLLEYDLKPLSIALIDLGRTYKIEYNTIDFEFINSLDQKTLITNRLLSVIKQRGDETRLLYLERLELEVNKEISRLQKTGAKLLKYIFIETPGQLKLLRSEQENGNLSQIIEYVKDGRNLSAYNVRFSVLESEEQFLLWELDSVELAHEFAEIDESDFMQWYTTKLQTDSYFSKNFSGLNYKQCKLKINLFVLRDLSNLSKTSKSPIQQYKEIIYKFNQGEISGQHLLNFLSLLLYRKVDQDELPTIESEILNLEKVRINGKEYSVNKQSIDILAYELIMPKTFQKEFGFDTYTDLNEVENDPDYFIKQYLRNKSTIVSSQYDIVLKRSNGDHIYILDSKHFRDDLGLVSIQDELMTIEENGRLYRIDEDGNNLYELLPGTEIFIDNDGHEVIVVKDTKQKSSLKLINHYVSNFKFGTIDFSKQLIEKDPDYLLNLVTKLKTNSRVGKFISNNITPENEITIESVINHINLYKDELITEYNYKEILNEYHPIWIHGRNKHTSFLKSLEVTAARIPSLSKLSYMAMKVVAYDNPNLNNAYVSTLLILLQGSDFDIDAVSLVTYDIDDNGILLTWSPYSNLTSKELLDSSLKLPIPSGVEVTQNFGNWKESGKFITKYFKLFDIRNDEDSVVIMLRKIDTVEQFELLYEFVKEKDLILPEDKFMFFNGLKAAGVLSHIPKNLDKAIDNLYSRISKFINAHNLYFNELSDIDLNRVINNITAYSLYESIIDPIDLILSLESVDGPTEPIKQIANDPNKSLIAKDSKKSTPGNFINKFESILLNSEGKDGIAISAVALKGFFALTYYYDTILDSGDPKLQNYLINDHRKLLANVRAKNPATVVNQEVVDILVQAGFQEDMAIQLSAMLGLSADNAKELALAKLNAGSKTISIYLYGLSIGLDFEKISTLMMGTTGRLIREVMDGDIYKGIDEYLSVEDALEYFTNGPKKLLALYDITFLNGQKIQSPLFILNKSLNEWNGNRDKNFGKYSNPLLDFIKLCKKYNYSLAELLKIIQGFENNYKSELGKIKYLLLLDFVQDYLCQMNDINPNDFKNIKFLAKGASEMKRLGEIAGLNQGLPTDLKGLLNKISKIEDIFEDFIPKDESKKTYLSKVKNILGDSIYINLERFAFEEKYRMNCIKAYDEIKHSFNILHAIATTPHLMGYVKTLAIAKMINTRSYKFRGIINNYRDLKENFKGTKDDIISGLENYIGDKLISNWMLSKNITITIPSGNYIFLPDGKLSENKTKEPVEISLGTDWGNATFKLWIENEVIPNLKQGKIKENISETRVLFNSFVKDIGANIRTNTVSGNSLIVFSLPINMLPRTDSEQILLDKYIDSFNALKEFNYETFNNVYSIVDLFAYYSMIAFNWKLSLNSLVNIFKNSEQFPIILSLHKFESDIDKSRYNVEDELFFKENIIPYIASKKGAYRSFGKYVWDVHPTHDVKLLMYKLPNNYNDYDDNYEDVSDEYQRVLIKNGYKFEGTEILDPNYFGTGKIKKISEIVEKEFRIETDSDKKKSVKTKITWSYGTGKDQITIDEYYDPVDNEIKKDYILIKNEELLNGNLPMKTINGNLTLDFEKIRHFIKLKLNGC